MPVEERVQWVSYARGRPKNEAGFIVIFSFVIRALCMNVAVGNVHIPAMPVVSHSVVMVICGDMNAYIAVSDHIPVKSVRYRSVRRVL
jgi:hypothetical protein